MLKAPNRTGFEEINAVVVQGFRVASGQSTVDKTYPDSTIRMQEPYFKKLGLHFRDVLRSSFVYGMLNLSIEPNIFEMVKPRYHFVGVKWTAVKGPEDFYFSPVRVIFQRKEYRGLLYYPDPVSKNQKHPNNPSVIEVIAQRIEGITYGSEVKLGYFTSAIKIIKRKD